MSVYDKLDATDEFGPQIRSIPWKWQQWLFDNIPIEFFETPFTIWKAIVGYDVRRGKIVNAQINKWQLARIEARLVEQNLLRWQRSAFHSQPEVVKITKDILPHLTPQQDKERRHWIQRFSQRLKHLWSMPCIKESWKHGRSI